MIKFFIFPYFFFWRPILIECRKNANIRKVVFLSVFLVLFLFVLYCFACLGIQIYFENIPANIGEYIIGIESLYEFLTYFFIYDFSGFFPVSLLIKLFILPLPAFFFVVMKYEDF